MIKRKVEFYQITVGNTTHYLTNSNRFETHLDTVYTPAPIDRSSIKLMSEMEKLDCSITLGRPWELSDYFAKNYIEESVHITILEKEFDQIFPNPWQNPAMVIWKGKLDSVDVDEGEVVLKFTSYSTTLKRSGAFRKYQRTCPYALYSKQCGVNKSDFSIGGYIESYSGKVVSVWLEDTQWNESALIAGVLDTDGIARFIIKAEKIDGESQTVERVRVETRSDVPGGGQINMIEEIVITYDGHSERRIVNTVPYDPNLVNTTTTYTDNVQMSKYSLEIFNRFFDINIEHGIIVSLGCDKAITTCKNRFSNHKNFGGFPLIPVSDPYKTSMG